MEESKSVLVQAMISEEDLAYLKLIRNSVDNRTSPLEKEKNIIESLIISHKRLESTLSWVISNYTTS